jgi:hypothetical protein
METYLCLIIFIILTAFPCQIIEYHSNGSIIVTFDNCFSVLSYFLFHNQ